MIENHLAYSVVQFSPRPESYEFVNVGVLVFDRRKQRVISKLSTDFGRVRRFFGDVSPSFLRMALSDFSQRVEYEFRKQNLSVSAAEFNSKRAGMFQITPVLPALGSNASQVAEDLFSELVVVKVRSPRARRVGSLLSEAFKQQGVLSLVQRHPKPVHIEKLGVSIKADFGYQNGVYNLIDAARFDESERGLAEAGKRVLEGRALAETLEHRLVVVGEFGERSADFIDYMKHEFSKAATKLFTIDEVNLLSEEIRETAH